MTPPPHAPALSFSGSAYLPWLAGFALLCTPLILSTGTSNLQSDEASYYLPAIAQIRSHWPHLDLTADSLSATAPGYPYFLASLSVLFGSSVTLFRVCNALVSLATLTLLWSLLRQRGGRALTLALLPLALSNFFVKSSGWVVTDNAALFATATTLLALFFIPGRNGLILAALAATGAVMTRQMSIWLIAPLAYRIWSDVQVDRRLWRFGLLALPIIPLVILVSAWGGLVPPIWQKALPLGSAFAGAPLIYLLTVVATLAPAYYYSMTTPSERRADLATPWLWTLPLAALILLASSNTLQDMDAGRWGGYWWSLAALLPRTGLVSWIFVPLAPLGALLAGILVRRLWIGAGPGLALLWLAAVLGWAGTCLVNRLVFQRYFEPPVLLFLVLWAALLAKSTPSPRAWPLVALATLQLTLTLVTVHAQAYGLVRFK
jgi:hypothetical protein